MLQAKKRRKDGLSRTQRIIMPTVIEGRPQKNVRKPQQEHVNARQHKTRAKKKRPKKFSWTPEKAEDLLKYLQDYKSSCDFKGIDFEADLACIPKCESSWREVMLRPLAQKKSVPQEEESRKWARMNMINTSSKSRLKRR